MDSNSNDPFFAVYILRDQVAALELRLENTEILAQAWKASAKEWRSKAQRVHEWTLAGTTKTHWVGNGAGNGQAG
jgi:hypothetical protein